jgi:hypothetical protein
MRVHIKILQTLKQRNVGGAEESDWQMRHATTDKGAYGRTAT